MSQSDSVHARIEALLSSNKVVLFMKGTAQMPQCGFSAKAAGTLQALDVEFTTVDVLSDPEIRQGIKDFSQWPTIPQLYVDKELIGGSDIVTQMAASGELHQALGIAYEPPKPPTLHATDAFVAEVQRFQAQGEPGHLRIQISPRWEIGIGISGEEAGDLEVEVNGLKILVDPDTARRADGLRLDFQGGIIVDNPNAPPVVHPLPVQGLKQLLDAGRQLNLFDVRTQEEWAIAHIEGAVLLDVAGQQKLSALPKEAMIVMLCHHGIRSAQAAGQLVSAGYRNVFNLEGGIDAWSAEVDPGVPRY
jgi:monothiol glutaredoxin